MEISWIESFFFGVISGLAEILPMSAQAHQSILLNLFGITDKHPMMALATMIGSVVAVAVSVSSVFRKIRRDYKMSCRSASGRKRVVNLQNVFDMKLLRTAVIPLLLGLFLYSKVKHWRDMVPVMALLLALNGLVLYLPSYFAKGNKDSRSMSRLDSLLIGIGNALGYLPGVSRMASGFSFATIRGADSEQAFKWTLILSVPALLGMICLDGYHIAASGMGATDSVFLVKCLVTAIASCIGTGMGIGMIKKLITRVGLEGFSYYCWGAALFSFILYMY